MSTQTSLVTPAFTQFFKPAEEYKDPPRLAVSLDGQDKCGKSHWAFVTTPDPIVVLTNDTGTKHVLDKAEKRYGRRVAGVCELTYPEPTEHLKTSDLEKHAKAEWAVWKAEWAKAKDAAKSLVGDKSVRTFVVDQATGLWKLCLLSHFGKLKSISQNLRDEANADFQSFFWHLYKGRRDLNIVLIHQLKKEYKENSKGEAQWTGKWERDGFNKIGYAVDLSLRCGWEQSYKDFYTEVQAEQATRFGAELSGQRWYGDASHSSDGIPSGFADLAMSIFPETELTPEYWGVR